MTVDYDDYYSSLQGTRQFNDFWRETHTLSSWGLATAIGIDSCLESGDLESEDKDKVILFLNQSALCRSVDNFQTYVVDIISAAFARNPDLISSKKLTRVGNIFKFSDLDELRRFAIEESSSDYGFKNVVDIDKDLRSRYGFGLLDGRLRQLRVRRLIEIRNCIVHNRGSVTHKFLDQCGSKRDAVGNVVRFPHPVHVDNYLHNVAVDIDLVAKSRFQLPREHAH